MATIMGSTGDGNMISCKHCDLNFNPKRKDMVFCSPRCVQKHWRQTNAVYVRDADNKRLKIWAKANRDKANAQKRRNYAKHSETVYAQARRYQKANPDAKNAWEANRIASKLKATPPWLTKDQKLEIRGYYKQAKELQWLSEDKLEVDHIIPLQGENVSGLHVPWNLQILPKSLNASKSNRVAA